MPAHRLPDSVYLNACDLIANGALIADACLLVGCGTDALRAWGRSSGEANAGVYARARVASAEALEAEALAIASGSTAESYQADRLRVDTLKWAAAKRNPRVYGDSVKHEHTGSIVGELHLAALQAPRVRATIPQSDAVPALGPGGVATSDTTRDTESDS